MAMDGLPTGIPGRRGEVARCELQAASSAESVRDPRSAALAAAHHDAIPDRSAAVSAEEFHFEPDLRSHRHDAVLVGGSGAERGQGALEALATPKEPSKRAPGAWCLTYHIWPTIGSAILPR